jgi:hypothetical protein
MLSVVETSGWGMSNRNYKPNVSVAVTRFFDCTSFRYFVPLQATGQNDIIVNRAPAHRLRGTSFGVSVYYIRWGIWAGE